MQSAVDIINISDDDDISPTGESWNRPINISSDEDDVQIRRRRSRYARSRRNIITSSDDEPPQYLPDHNSIVSRDNGQPSETPPPDYHYHHESWFGNVEHKLFFLAFFMLLMSLMSLVDNMYHRIILPPNITTDELGMVWPGSTLNFDPRHVMRQYRMSQRLGYFAPVNALTLRIDYPKTCIITPFVWNHGGSTDMLEKDIFNCYKDSSKTVFLVPILMYGDNNAHAQIAIFNKTAMTMEIFDPLGVREYATYDNIPLTSRITDVAINHGFTRVIQSALPVQMVENINNYIDIGGGMCQAFVYWYTRVLLANLDVPSDIRNERIAMYLDHYGIGKILGFVDATLERSQNLVSRNRFLLELDSVSHPEPYHNILLEFKEFARPYFFSKSPSSSMDERKYFVLEYNRYWMDVLEGVHTHRYPDTWIYRPDVDENERIYLMDP